MSIPWFWKGFSMLSLTNPRGKWWYWVAWRSLEGKEEWVGERGNESQLLFIESLFLISTSFTFQIKEYLHKMKLDGPSC